MATVTNLSKLGYGLSSIAGSGSFSHQQRLIKTAIDSGITHFDVAPYYGSGDAEKILGDILSTCSQKVTITTKFGLVPLGDGPTGRWLRSSLRPIFRRVGSLKRIVSSVITHTHRPKTRFEKGSLLASLDSSMSKLRHPIKIFLLHDPDPEFVKNDELIEELNEVRKTGRVSLIGVSGSANIVYNSVRWSSDTYKIAQLENSLNTVAPIVALSQFGTGIITHRAIQGGLNSLVFLLRNRPGFKKIWLREIGIDPSNIENLAQVLIEIALAENPDGTILFSTTSPDRIKKVSLAVTSPQLSEEGCKYVRKLFNEVNLEGQVIIL